MFLQSERWVSAEVVDAWYAAMMIEIQKNKQQYNIYYFGSYLLERLFNQGVDEIKSEIARHRLWEKDLWFLPIWIGGNHFTLLIVNFRYKLQDDGRKKLALYYLDSYGSRYAYKAIKPKINSVLYLIRHLYTEKTNKSWENWNDADVTIYAPTEKLQRDSTSCGVYVCYFIYIIAVSRRCQLDDETCEYFRNYIAEFLYENYKYTETADNVVAKINKPGEENDPFEPEEVYRKIPENFTSAEVRYANDPINLTNVFGALPLDLSVANFLELFWYLLEDKLLHFFKS